VRIDKLKLCVQLVGLEFLFAVVLEADEAPDEQHRVAQKPQEKALRIADFIP